jgi:hypothetical protein
VFIGFAVDHRCSKLTDRALFAVRRLINITPGEFADLLLAQWFLLAALWTVRRRPRGSLLRPLQGVPPADGKRNDAKLERMALAVDRVARFGLFRPTCLVRALALERQISRVHAGPAVVRIGVRHTSGELLAHAWIELDGRVIGDEPARVLRYTPLRDFSALVG